MPKERFLNLPEEKKQRIIDAAVAEFSRVPFDQVSINKIIRSAEIPRGSFYQYFDDKLDLLSFILQDLGTELEHTVLQVMEETKGDLFAVCLAVVDMIATIGQRPQNEPLFEHVFPHLKFQECKYIFPYLEVLSASVHHPESIQEISPASVSFLSMLKKYQFGGISLDDLPIVMELVASIMWYTLTQALFHTEEWEIIRANYEKKLAIVKRGLEREGPAHVEI